MTGRLQTVNVTVEDVGQPNAKTIAAIEEGHEGLERFASVDALFAELDS